MNNWNTIYSVLKMTREGKGNKPIEDEKIRQYIASIISIADIKKMGKEELQEGLINYLEVVNPEFGQDHYSREKEEYFKPL